MEYRILGPLELSDEDGVISLDAPKQRTLIGVLLLHANQVVPSERLIEEIWGERPPATASKVVQTYVSQLRRTLGPDTIQTQAPGYILRLDDEALDAARFRRLEGDARRVAAGGNAAAAGDLHRDALALWRGPALADVTFESFARNEVEGLAEERLDALAERIDCELELGHDGDLVAELETLVKEHPLRERVRAQLMLALYRSGRQADALAVYRAARATLVGELGLEPGPELQDLEQAILRHEPALRAPPRSQSPKPPRRLLLATGATALAVLAVALALVLRSGSSGLASAPPNTVAVIDASSNELVAAVPVGIDPGAIAAGSGAVWAANEADGTVSRIDPRVRRVVRTVPVGGYPSDLVAGDGSVWVAQGPLATVVRVPPEQNRAAAPIAALGERLACGRAAASVSLGARSVWFACEAGEVGRVNARTGKATRVAYDAGLLTTRIPVAPEFSDLAFGLGSLWLVNRVGNAVIELDPVTNQRVREIPVGRAPSGVAVGRQSLWVTNFGDDSVWRIGISGRASPPTVEPIEVGDEPTDVAIGGGAAWVVNSGDGTVSRIDLEDSRVTVIRVGSELRHVAFAEGAVWVTVREPAK